MSRLDAVHFLIQIYLLLEKINIKQACPALSILIAYYRGLETTDFLDFVTVRYLEKYETTFRGLNLLPSSGEGYVLSWVRSKELILISRSSELTPTIWGLQQIKLPKHCFPYFLIPHDGQIQVISNTKCNASSSEFFRNSINYGCIWTA
jgi:hypothetical protein